MMLVSGGKKAKNPLTPGSGRRRTVNRVAQHCVSGTRVCRVRDTGQPSGYRLSRRQPQAAAGANPEWCNAIHQRTPLYGGAAPGNRSQQSPAPAGLSMSVPASIQDCTIQGLVHCCSAGTRAGAGLFKPKCVILRSIPADSGNDCCYPDIAAPH
jgi:hypothetical protein